MTTEDEIILAMCRAHDREDSAQRGEPSPWREDFDRDPDWEQERFLAMREAFDVAREAIMEEAARIAERKAQEFLSPEYALGQPFSSFSERFACDQVAAAIRAALRQKGGA